MNRTPHTIDRRRLLLIAATFAGSAAILAPQVHSGHSALIVWNGQALGAHATIRLAGAPQDVADEAFAAVEKEILRLEEIFSLYRVDSTLSRLNREGRITAPAPDFLAVLSLAATAHRLTSGLFDPTVQPLFVVFAEHFAAEGADPDGPPPTLIREALAKVGLAYLSFDANNVAFNRPGMGVTLNGIAQGYITDRVAALLKERGFSNMLLDIGEIAAVGTGLDGAGWRVGLQRAPDSEAIAERLFVSDRAVATSASRGTTLDRQGRFGHILHPRTGEVAPAYPRVTVIDRSAARADALSTGAALMDANGIVALRRQGIDVRV